MKKSVPYFWMICAYGTLLLGVMLTFALFVLCYFRTDNPTCSHAYDFIFKSFKDNPGEFLGGIIGTIFSLTATVFLVITFNEQRKQFEISQNNEFYTRFETTFFNMLGMLKKVQDSVNDNINNSGTYDGQETMSGYYKRFKSKYSKDLGNDVNFVHLKESLSQDTPQLSEILKAKQSFGAYFEKYVNESKCNLGFFYRYIYNVINFVCSQTGFKLDSEKEKYINLLQAQLSDEELALIFYDAISKFAENKEGFQRFHDLLDEIHFLENISQQVLLDEKHFYFYPKTPFKFMSREERKNVRVLFS